MDFTTFIANINTGFLGKIFFLILLGLFIVFIFMLFNKIRSFDRIIILKGQAGAGFLKLILFIYLLALLFLFVISLVIV